MYRNGGLTASVSAIALAIGMSSAPVPARAAVCTGVISGAQTGEYDWTTGDCSISGAITSTVIAVAGSGVLGALTNSGTLTGGNTPGGYGVSNTGSFSLLDNTGTIAAYSGVSTTGPGGTLSNAGTIIGTGGYGVSNNGSIGGFDNGGTVATNGATAIYNSAGIIGTLTNSGVVSAMSGSVILSEGTIGTLNNTSTGTITGGSSGSSNAAIKNGGVIDALTNSGHISGPTVGIYNYNPYPAFSLALIGALTNNAGGTISSITNGNVNGDSGLALIGSLSNAAGGDISGITNGSKGTIGGSVPMALTNNGMIGYINNTSGTILGATGIMNSGSIGALANSGSGLISSVENTGFIGAAGVQGVSNTATIGAINNAASGTIAGAATGIFDAGTLGTLTNNGSITGGHEAVLLAYTVSLVENSGMLSGDGGLYNFGIVDLLLNTGTIAALHLGIFDAGKFDSFVNDGVISGAVGLANFRVATISAMTNGGTISGTTTGLINSGTIGSLSNSGAITGGKYGFDNGETHVNDPGSITALTNTGSISGGSTGIYNGGTIGTITNSGTISGGAAGIYSGTVTSSGTPVIVSSAVITQITNTGTISGLTGIDLTGGGTTLFNAGTIASTDGGNAIFFGGVNDLVLTTGAVLLGTIQGNGTASQITLEGSGSLDSDIAGFGPGAALAVTPGAAWAGSGNWDIPIVTNDGTFQGGHLGTPLTLTGDYLQNADGTLQVLVTPAESTLMNVSGTATLSGGVTYLLPPGHYLPHVYPYLTASAINGTFTSVNYGDIPTGFATTDTYGDPSVNFVITRAFYLPNIVNPTGSAIFSAQAQALAQSADADTSSLLNKATLGGAVASPACAAEESLAPNQTSTNGVTKTAQISSMLANVFCGAGGWIEAAGSLNEAGRSGGATSYNADTGGFLAGIDRVMNAVGTRIGVAIGYARTSLTDKLGDGGGMDTTRAALYAAQPIGRFTLAGVLAYGNASDNTSRATAIGNLGASSHESIFSGGAQLSTMITMQNINFEPAAGLRIARVDGGGNFTESATGIAAAYAVSGKYPSYTSVQPFLLLSASESFITASGVTVTPNAQIGVEYEAADRGVATSLITANGFTLDSPHNSLDPEDALVSLGITASKHNWSLFATYTGRLSGNWNSQTAAAGARLQF
jgi:uncharacterized protein with beta-barrel porin domain